MHRRRSSSFTRYIYNAPVNSRDFAYAAEGFGPPKHFKLGTATIDTKLPYEDLVTECKENEVVLETDIGTFGKRQYLISKALPTHYGVVIPLGAKTKNHRPRSRKNLKKVLVETINIISKNGVKVKYILHDGENRCKFSTTSDMKYHSAKPCHPL